MEARSLSECGVISDWGVVEVQESMERHIVGHSSYYNFFIVTQKIIDFHYDYKTRQGSAITDSGILYSLAGKPIVYNPNKQLQLIEFKKKNNCELKPVKIGRFHHYYLNTFLQKVFYE